MKLFSLRSLIATTLLASTLCFSASVWAQTEYTGHWEGEVNLPGQSLKVTVQLQVKDGQWQGTIDIPQQNARNLELGDIQLTNGDLTFVIKGIPGTPTFKGRLNPKQDQLSGNFIQGGRSFPFELHKPTENRAEIQANLQAELKSLKQEIEAELVKWQGAGLAIAIVKDDQVLFSEGIGYRDLEKKLPVTLQTRFAIGSATKAFTATLLGTLVDQDKLAWDKPVRHYLPDFQLKDRFATERMTLRDLLCHDSGLPRHDLMWYGSNATRSEMYKRLQYLEPSSDFRTHFQYQNLMYMTAGVLAEKVTGKTWEALIQERIFNPLKMTSSSFSSTQAQAQSPDVAIPYLKQKNQLKAIPYRDIQAVGPAGTIYSNLQDMTQWLRMNLNGGRLAEAEVVSGSTLQYIQSPQMILGAGGAFEEIALRLYALGWFYEIYRGHTLLQHGGNIDGFSALVSLMPKEGLGIVILSNKNGDSLPSALMYTLYDKLLKLPKVDWGGRLLGLSKAAEEALPQDHSQVTDQKQGTKPSQPLSAYQGSFQHPGYGKLGVSLDKGALHLVYNGFRLKLKHWHYDVFAIDSPETPFNNQKVLFQSNLAGDLNEVSLSMDPAVEAIHFQRLPAEHLKERKYLSQFIGDYRFQELVLKVELKDSGLWITSQGQPAMQLEPAKEDLFNVKGLDGFAVKFEFKAGKVVAAQLRQPNGTFRAEKAK